MLIILIGEVQGSSSVLVLHRDLAGENVLELKTIGVLASSSVIVEPGKLLIGHLDGTLLLYNFGDYQEVFSISHRVMGCDNIVVKGDEITNTTLQQVTDACCINAVSFNEELGLVFGYERFFIEEKNRYCYSYSIWNVHTGEVVKTFHLEDLEIEVPGYERYQMKINDDFTYILVRSGFTQNSRFYLVEIATEVVLHRYEYQLSDWQISVMDNVLWGMGKQSNEMWLFHVSTLLLENIDIDKQETISRRYISERMSKEFADYLPFWFPMWFLYDDAFYFGTGRGIMVFTGSNSYVYSFYSNRTIFTGDIRRVSLDGSAIYVGESLSRVPLTHEELFEALNQSPFIGTMTEEDIRLTRLDIFD